MAQTPVYRLGFYKLGFYKLGFLAIFSFFQLLLVYPAVAQQWQLVWSDEFDSDSLDLSKWTYQTGTGEEYGLDSWGNNELQYYTGREENIFIRDGKLHIVAHDEIYEDRYFTSARINTKNKGDWQHGRFEIRAKLPKGPGFWPAIWMLPTENVYGIWPQSGEIDIMELVGHEPHRVHGTVHYGPMWPDNLHKGSSYTLSDGTFNDDFHVFSIEWSLHRIKWFVNDEHYFTIVPNDLAPHNWPFEEKFHLLLNVAVGGNWPGNPDHTSEFPQEMVVDYVRVYQEKSGTSAEEAEQSPDAFLLYQNHPNPFNPETDITFSLSESSHVRIEIYDMLGRFIALASDGHFEPGRHTVRFDGSDLSSGSYIYRLVSGSQTMSRLMMLIK